jgi:cytochrome c5
MSSMMKYRQTFGALALVALSVPSSAGQNSSTPAAGAANTADRVERITLPNYSGEVLKGPNVEVYEKDCLGCHSSRYVTMQPRFARQVWEKEVKKMVDAYGATVSEADETKIVEYLVAVRGVPESKDVQNSR